MCEFSGIQQEYGVTGASNTLDENTSLAGSADHPVDTMVAPVKRINGHSADYVVTLTVG